MPARYYPNGWEPGDVYPPPLPNNQQPYAAGRGPSAPEEYVEVIDLDNNRDQIKPTTWH